MCEHSTCLYMSAKELYCATHNTTYSSAKLHIASQSTPEQLQIQENSISSNIGVGLDDYS